MSIFDPLFQRLSMGADYSKVRALEKQILEVVRKQPPGFNVQIPLKDEAGEPLPEYVGRAIIEMLKKHPELEVLSFGASVTVCRKFSLRATLSPEDMQKLQADGLAYSQENVAGLEGFVDKSKKKPEESDAAPGGHDV